MSHREAAAAGASRSLAAAHRRLVRVGPVTPMRAAPLAAAGVVSAPDRMSNAANFRSHFNSASRVQGLAAPLARA